MAITDNNFTADELREAIKTTPTLIDIVAGIALDNDGIKKIIEPKIIAPITKTHAETVEKDVFELTGVKKEGDEKYYDYLKRAYKVVTDKLNEELTTLKGKHNPSEADKKLIEQLQAQLRDKDAEHTKALQAEQAKTQTAILTAAIKTEVDKLKMKADLPETLVNMAKQKAVEDLLKEAKLQDDNAITLMDGDNVRQNKSTYKPLSISERLAEMLPDVIDQGVKQPGAGSNPNPNDPPKGDPKNPGAGAGKYTGIPSTVKTKVQLTEHLNAQGILDTSEDWNKAFADADAANLPLR